MAKQRLPMAWRDQPRAYGFNGPPDTQTLYMELLKDSNANIMNMMSINHLKN